ncbi:MAG: hypothetical protein JNK05_37310 [Myxococcales bacterium]|nr:hypothetical protein [Myxococcales bacterium]
MVRRRTDDYESDESSDPRASPEAIRKRRAARKLNDLLAGHGSKPALDGRTELKRRRLLTELERNTNNRGKPLKPVEVLQHADELLSFGETMATLRKLIRVTTPPVSDRDELVAMLREVHEAYGFRSEVYEFLGLGPEVLADAELGPGAPRRGRPKRAR